MKLTICRGIIFLLVSLTILFTFPYNDVGQACHDDAACPHNPPLFKIGVSLPLDGKFVKFGTEMRRGYELWAMEAMERGGIAGNKIEFIFENDGGDITKVLANTELFSQIDVDLIFGNPSDYMLPAVLPLAYRLEYPIIFPSSSNVEQLKELGQSEKSPYGFMLLSPIKNFIETTAEIAKNLNVKRVAIMSENGFMINNIGGIFKNRGFEIILFDPFESERTDFGSYVKKIADYKAEAIFFFNINISPAIAFTRQLKEQYSNFRMFLVDYTDDDAFKNSLENLTEGILTRASWHEKLRTPNNQKFVEIYKKKYGYNESPSQNAAIAYAIGELYEKAITEMISKHKGKNLQKVLLQLNTSSIIGDYKIGNFGVQEKQKDLLIQWQAGIEQIIWPSDYRTANLR